MDKDIKEIEKLDDYCITLQYGFFKGILVGVYLDPIDKVEVTMQQPILFNISKSERFNVMSDVYYMIKMKEAV